MIKQNPIHQELLKFIACGAMLLDHLGAFFLPLIGLRIIGRLAFPIYCFLLTEGAVHTRSPKGYALRLGIGALLSEVPFDLLAHGSLTWQHQNVMVTLLLGFAMLSAMKKATQLLQKLLIIVPFYIAAELLRCNYGGAGILIIAVFALTKDIPAQALLLAVISLLMNSFSVPIGTISIPIQLFSLLALVPIALYSGRKATESKCLQWSFYLFYPVHLVILYLFQEVLL